MSHNWFVGYAINVIKAKLTVRRPNSVSKLILTGYCPPDLTEAIDIYSEWIDAADAAQREEQVTRRPAASSSRPAPAPASIDSDDE